MMLYEISEEVLLLNLIRDGVTTLDLACIKEPRNIRNRGTAWRILDDNSRDEAFAKRMPLVTGFKCGL